MTNRTSGLLMPAGDMTPSAEREILEVFPGLWAVVQKL